MIGSCSSRRAGGGAGGGAAGDAGGDGGGAFVVLLAVCAKGDFLVALGIKAK